MTIKNRIHNWWHGIKRFRGKGCKNVAMVTDLYGVKIVTKYDWSKPFVYETKPVELVEPRSFKIIRAWRDKSTPTTKSRI